MITDQGISWVEVEHNYPAPIAVASRLYNSCAEERDPTRKLICLFSVLEASLRYLCYILTADWISRQPDASDVISIPDWMVKLEVNKSLTLGEWTGAVRWLVSAMSPSTTFIPELLTTWNDNKVKRIINDMVPARNRFIHPNGAIAWTDEEVRDFLASEKPQVAVLLGHLSFLRDYPLCIAAEGSLFGSVPGNLSPRNEYTLLRCMGASRDYWPRSTPLALDQSLHPESPFLLNLDGTQLLYLWPFITDGISDRSFDHELYLFEHQQARWLRQVNYFALQERVEETRSWATMSDDYGWLVQRAKEMSARTLITSPHHVLERVRERAYYLEQVTMGTTRRYQIKRRIGEGSMGTVYYAEDENGQHFAIKVMHPHLTRALLRRFELEIRSLEILRGHPNILLVIDWGVHSGPSHEEWHYCVTEYAERGDLATYLRNHCRSALNRSEIPELESLTSRIWLYQQFVTGVAEMHDKQFVHRDLKPSNALIMADGSVRVADMGVVKFMGVERRGTALTQRGSVVGTLGYMAPEQQMGLADLIKESSDVFALGIILFETIFGRLPRQDVERADNVLLEQQALSTLPRSLRQVILRCTRKQQSTRYQNARRFLEAFEPAVKELLTGEVVIGTDPAGAQVLVDGEPILLQGAGTITLQAGEHVLVAQIQGHPPGQPLHIRVIPQKQERVKLNAQPVSVAAASEPSAAEAGPVTLDHYLEKMNVRLTMHSFGYGMEEALVDDNSRDIWKEMVGTHGDSLVPELVERLRTEDREIQAKLMCLLTCWGDPRRLEIYLSQIQTQVIPHFPRVAKGRWLEFLGTEPEATAAQLLDTLSREPDIRLKLSIPGTLGRSRRHEIQTELIVRLNQEPDAALRGEIVRALDPLNPGSRAVLLRYLHQDPNPSVRLQIAYNLGQGRDLNSFDPLLQAARTDTDPQTRTGAVIGLLNIDREKARTALRELIDEGDRVLFASIREGLRQAGETSLLAHVEQMELQLGGEAQ